MHSEGFSKWSWIASAIINWLKFYTSSDASLGLDCRGPGRKLLSYIQTLNALSVCLDKFQNVAG